MHTHLYFPLGPQPTTSQWAAEGSVPDVAIPTVQGRC
jgi:hypothetical protein